VKQRQEHHGAFAGTGRISYILKEERCGIEISSLSGRRLEEDYCVAESRHDHLKGHEGVPRSDINTPPGFHHYTLRWYGATYHEELSLLMLASVLETAGIDLERHSSVRLRNGVNCHSSGGNFLRPTAIGAVVLCCIPEFGGNSASVSGALCSWPRRQNTPETGF
jgi:hypothetical protein